MTVYYQFGSKIGLLEALTDALAAQGGMQQLASAFRERDPLAALDTYIAVFSRFWDADRLVTRRLRALAALDADFEHVIGVRNEQRRQGLRVLIGQLAKPPGRLPPATVAEAVDLLYTLLSFESFDTLAGPTRSLEDVAPIVQRPARAALSLDER